MLTGARVVKHWYRFLLFNDGPGNRGHKVWMKSMILTFFSLYILLCLKKEGEGICEKSPEGGKFCTSCNCFPVIIEAFSHGITFV